MNPLVLTDHPLVAVEEFADFWSFRANTRHGAMGCAEFTCDADRPHCAALLREMWNAKLLHLATLDKRMLTTLFGVLQSKLFCIISEDAPFRYSRTTHAPLRKR